MGDDAGAEDEDLLLLSEDLDAVSPLSVASLTPTPTMTPPAAAFPPSLLAANATTTAGNATTAAKGEDSTPPPTSDAVEADSSTAAAAAASAAGTVVSTTPSSSSEERHQISGKLERGVEEDEPKNCCNHNSYPPSDFRFPCLEGPTKVRLSYGIRHPQQKRKCRRLASARFGNDAIVVASGSGAGAEREAFYLVPAPTTAVERGNDGGDDNDGEGKPAAVQTTAAGQQQCFRLRSAAGGLRKRGRYLSCDDETGNVSFVTEGDEINDDDKGDRTTPPAPAASLSSAAASWSSLSSFSSSFDGRESRRRNNNRKKITVWKFEPRPPPLSSSSSLSHADDGATTGGIDSGSSSVSGRDSSGGSGGGGGWRLVDTQSNRELHVDARGTVFATPPDDGNGDNAAPSDNDGSGNGSYSTPKSYPWSIELLSGELCYLSHPSTDRRIRCDLTGRLALTEDMRGWEVWRFVEAAGGGTSNNNGNGGSVYHITSWMHDGRKIKCDETGNVYTSLGSSGSEKRGGGNSGGGSISAAGSAAALSSSLSSSFSSLSMMNKKANQQKAAVVEEGENDGGNVEQQEQQREEEDPWEMWTVDVVHENGSANRGTTIRSVANGWILSYDGIGGLRTVPPPTLSSLSLEDEDSNNGVWHLEAAHSQTYRLASYPSSSSSSSTSGSGAVGKGGGGSPTTTTTTKTVGPFPYVTENLGQSDEWKVERRIVMDETDDDVDDTDNDATEPVVITFYSISHQQYLGWDCGGDGSAVKLSSDVKESELWMMAPSSDGTGHVFVSYAPPSSSARRKMQRPPQCKDDDEADDGGSSVVGGGIEETEKEEERRCLTYCDNAVSMLCTVPFSEAMKNGQGGTKSVWRLEPRMPRAVSGKKIKTFAAATAAAVATTVAMPFAVTGVVGLLGAEAGVLVDIVAVGMTSVEALASVGAVGATAALVFTEPAHSLSSTEHGAPSSSEGEGNEAEKKATKQQEQRRIVRRPLCAWRTW